MKIVSDAIFGLLLGIAVSALLAFPVMLLWNACLVGTVAGISTVGFLQAWGIMILSEFLFKSNTTVSTNK